MNPALRWIPGVALIALLAAAVVVLMTAQSRQRIAGLQDEALRLAQDEARLTESLDELRSGTYQTASLDPRELWRADTSGSVEVKVQQVLVEAAKRSGLTLASFGSGVPLEDVQAPTLAYDLELSGPHESVARILADLERQQPALAISFLWLRQIPVDPSKPGSPLQMRISVWGLVEAEGP
jgi:hypothetical protein